MNRQPAFSRLIITVLLLCVCSTSYAVVYDLRAKKDSETNRYGYENRGDKYFWWKEAHRLGADKEEVNQSYETQWVITPQYDKVSKEFSEGLAAVEIDGKVGFIDKHNRFIIPPQFEPMDKLEGFKFGMAVVKKDGKYGFIDKRGIFVIQPGFDGAENFGSDYLAVVKMGKKFGCIDLLGDTVVPCEHLAKEVMKTMPGKNKKYREEKKRAKARWDDGYYSEFMESITDSSDFVARLISDSLYIPPTPAVPASVTQSQAVELKHGFYLISEGNKKGVADAWGRTVIPVRYESVSYQPEQHLFIIEEKKAESASTAAGLASMAGGWIIPPVFDHIDNFDGPAANATIGKYSTQLDVNGLVELRFLEDMLMESASEDGVYYTRKLLGVMPSLAPAHNNLGIYYASSCDDLKHAIKHFSVAHDLDPDNEEFESNMKAAKSERNSRRWNRVLTGMQIAAAVISIGAVTYSAVSGNSAMASSDFSNSSSYSASEGTSSGSHRSSSASSSGKDSEGISPSKATKIQSLRRSYDRYESMVVDCNTYPEKHQPGDKAEYQQKMRSIRQQLAEMGVNRSKSPHETN